MSLFYRLNPPCQILSKYKIRDCFILGFFVGKSRPPSRFADKTRRAQQGEASHQKFRSK